MFVGPVLELESPSNSNSRPEQRKLNSPKAEAEFAPLIPSVSIYFSSLSYLFGALGPEHIGSVLTPLIPVGLHEPFFHA